MKNIKRGLSKIRPEDKEKPFYNTRLDICKACPFNTNNGAETDDFEVKAILTASSLLKDLVNREGKNGNCVKCGCYIDKKIVYADEFCPEGKWGKEEEDEKNIFKLDDKTIFIVTKSPIKELKKVENHYEIDLGDIKKDTVENINISVKNSNQMLTEVTFSCGCMLANDITKKEDNYYDISIRLSTKGKLIKQDETGCYLIYKNGKKVILIFKYNICQQ